MIMKQNVFSLFLVVFLTCTLVVQAQIIAWDFDGNAGNEFSVAPTTLDPNLEVVSNLTRGTNFIIGPALANSFNSDTFIPTGFGFTIQDALVFGRFLFFQFRTPSCPFQVSLSTLDANFRRGPNGPVTFDWLYTIDGANAFQIGSTITFNSANTNGVAQAQIDLSGITDLQDVSSDTTITIILVIRNSNNLSGEFALGRLAGNDLSIGGTITQPLTTWNGSSWDNGVPDIGTAAILDGNYNTASNGSFSACSLTVNSGVNLVVSDNTFVQIENNTTVNGDISLQSQGSFVQVDDTGTFGGSGTSSVTKQTPVKPDWFFFNYWSSPVQGETIADTFFDVDGDRRFFFNASNYLDGDGDGFDDNGDDWQFALGGTTMTPGVGYATTSSRLGAYPSSRSATFEGPFNTGDINTPVAFNGGSADSWNLIGNPYPGAIDFDAFHSNNNFFIDGVAYFWSQATPPSSGNPGGRVSNFSQSDYATYTVGTGGTAGASGVIPDQFVPSGQGFFVRAIAPGNVTFTNAMRQANTTSNSQFFKRANTQGKSFNTQNEFQGVRLNGKPSEDRIAELSRNGIELPNDVSTFGPVSSNADTGNTTIEENKLWLNLTTDSGVFSQVLVGYVNGATNANDGSFYDAPKIINRNFNAVIYSQIDNDTEKYAVQGRAIDDLGNNIPVKIGFASTINEATTYKFSIAQVLGKLLTSNTIYIKDNLLGTTHNLSEQDYTFTSDTGEFNDRFEITFEILTLSTSNLDTPTTKDLNISQVSDNEFIFTINNATIKALSIIDLLGKEVYAIKTNSNSKRLSLDKLRGRVYIANATLDNGSVISKKFIVR